MIGFSASWLDLRFPLDAEARNAAIETIFVDALPEGRPIRLVDLASGSGSTVRMLHEKIDQQQNWVLLDHDERLLSVAKDRLAALGACSVRTKQADLSADDLGALFGACDAVTTSAFLDLVSEDFLERLIEAVTRRNLPFLASLTYDGRSFSEPPHPFDEKVLDAMNRDQRTDKGFGPALGPEAANRCRELFEEAGYRILTGPSDWQIGPEAVDFQTEFLAGLKRVAERSSLPQAGIDDWFAFRQKAINDGQSRMMVGHQDLLALPE